MGLFMRDFMYYDNLVVFNEVLDKVYYVIKMVVGFVVDFMNNELGEKLFKGLVKIVYKELIQQCWVYYVDVFIGYLIFLMISNILFDNYIGIQCFILVCENLKLEVVLFLF